MSTVEPRVVHVVVGPEQHGVVRHARLVADALGHRCVRAESVGADRDVDALDLGDAEVVHLAYTDRLFGAQAEQSAATVEALVAPWLAAGRALSLTLHDLPAGDDDRERRRAQAYRRVLARASGVVVNSWRELELVRSLLPESGPRSLRCIPLPLEPARPEPARTEPARPEPAAEPSGPDATREVVVLGYLFPDRGYEHTLTELPPGVTLRAVGRPSAGHEDLPAALDRFARAHGTRLDVTGYVPDAELDPLLRAAAVPVAPNRRVAASASVNTWIAHGRRPLVPDSPYARELDQRTPGTITRYDADQPGALREAVAHALADPASTRLPADAVLPPDLATVADAYRRHLAGAAAPTPLALPDGRVVVPGNRFDLADRPASDRPTPEPPTVTVVVPYFEAQAELDLVLGALTLQTHPTTRLQVVIADDGSQAPPRTSAVGGLDGTGGLDVQVVRQPDLGFRAAAARNLGAGAADGQVLVFLDADTVPEPSYVERLTRRPAVLPDTLAVGRRRHADLTGWTPPRWTDWQQGRRPGPSELTEPVWLREAYAASRDLLDADARSYRHIISAVMALDAGLFAELGGFDEWFTRYGGEDWELAHRAWVAGAVLAHEPEAVAWHAGPDWGERPEAARRGAKNAETLALAAVLPDPDARGGGFWPQPAVAVVLGFADPEAVLVSSRSVLAEGADVGVWVDHADAEAGLRTLADVGLADDRIQPGPVPPSVAARVRATLKLHTPARVEDVAGLLRAAERYGPLRLPVGELVPHRVSRRAARWADDLGVAPALLAARLFGGRDESEPRPCVLPIDLAHELGRIARARP